MKHLSKRIGAVCIGVLVLGTSWAEEPKGGNTTTMGQELPGRRFLTSGREVLEEEPGPVLVDVGHKDRFDRIRISGSIHVPLFAVRTKSFLRSKHVVLVDEGWGGEDLRAECLRLRDAGFESVAVLEGGLNHWAASGRPVEGDMAALRQVYSIPAAALRRVIGKPDWVAVDVRASADAADPSALSEAIRESCRTEPSGRFEALEERLHAGPSDGLINVVVADEDGNYGPVVDACVQRMREVPGGERLNVYFLEGGIARYRAFLDAQAAMNSPTRVRMTTEGCPSCPK